MTLLFFPALFTKMNFETTRNTDRRRIAIEVIYMVAAYPLFWILFPRRLYMFLHSAVFDRSAKGNLLVMTQSIGIGHILF